MCDRWPGLTVTVYHGPGEFARADRSPHDMQGVRTCTDPAFLGPVALSSRARA